MAIRIDKNQLLMLRKKIEDLGKLSAQELSNELGITSLKIVESAKNYVPVKDGNLKSSIGAERQNKQNVRVFAKAVYAPYIEFGTGRGVTLREIDQLGIPRSYAEQFKGKGKGRGFVYARPYFFPAVRKEFDELEKRLDLTLNRLANK
jgi:hypothetical protein